MAAGAGVPSLDPTLGLPHREFIFPPNILCVAPLQRIRGVWVANQDPIRLQNDCLAPQKGNPHHLAEELDNIKGAVTRLSDLRDFSLIPIFNEEEMATLRRSLLPSYVAHGMTLHIMLSVILLANLPEGEERSALLKCLRSCNHIIPFLDESVPALYPIFEKKKEELKILLQNLQEQNISSNSKKICKLWERHISYPSYDLMFIKNGCTDHLQLADILTVRKDKQKMNQFIEVMTTVYDLPPIDPKRKIEDTYRQLLEEYFKPRGGQTYTSYRQSQAKAQEAELRAAMGNPSLFISSPVLNDPAQTTARNFLLNAYAFQFGDCAEYFNPDSIPIACTRSLKTFQSLFERPPELQSPKIRGCYSNLLDEALRAFNSKTSGKAAENLCKLAKFSDAESFSRSEITDTLRKITNDVRLDFLLDTMKKLKKEIFKSSKGATEQEKKEFLQLIEFALNITRLQLDIYRLRDLHVHPTLDGIEEEIMALDDFSTPSEEVSQQSTVNSTDSAPLQEVSPPLKEERTSPAEEKPEPVGAGAAPAEETPRTPRTTIIAPKPISPEEKKLLQEEKNWIIRHATPQGSPKPRALMEELQNRGFVLERNNGSHQIWKHPKFPVTVGICPHNGKDSTSPKMVAQLYKAISAVDSAVAYRAKYNKDIPLDKFLALLAR